MDWNFEPMLKTSGQIDYESLVTVSSGHIIDVDLGETFTNIIISTGQQTRSFKIETDPHDVSSSLRNAFSTICGEFSFPSLRSFLNDTLVLRMTSSLATNILVERKGSRCGLILERGWKERFCRQFKDDLPNALISADLVSEFSYIGGNFRAGDSNTYCAELAQVFRALSQNGAEIVVVSMDGGDDFGAKENFIKSSIYKLYPRHCLGAIPVVMSNKISSGSDYLIRTNTALISAHCHQPLKAGFHQIERFLDTEGYTKPLLIVHSGGATARVAKTKAVQVIDSGPSASVYGVERITRKLSLPYAISVDIGGTTTSIGLLLKGNAQIPPITFAAGLPVDLNVPLISSLAVGGRSVAVLDRNGVVSLGPNTGPDCYEKVTTAPTLTDALLVLGYLDGTHFLGGRQPLDRSAAIAALDNRVAIPLHLSTEQAALKVKRAAIEQIGHSIFDSLRVLNLAPTEAILFALGGCAGCLAAELTDYVGALNTILPPFHALFGAYSSCGMNVGHVYRQQVGLPVREDKASGEELCRRLNEIVLPLHRIALNDLKGEGFKQEEIQFTLELELVAPSQPSSRADFSYPFLWPSKDWQIIRKFAKNLLRDNPYAVRVSQVNLRAFSQLHRSQAPSFSGSTESSEGPMTCRVVYRDSLDWQEVQVYRSESLQMPSSFKGPILIESLATTVYVPEGHMLTFDASGMGVIEICQHE